MSALLTAVHGAERGWVWLYTAGMPAESAERRRGEVAADAWAHLQWALDREESELRTAVQASVQFIGGILSDVSWRLGLRAAGFSRAMSWEAVAAFLIVLGCVAALPAALFFGFQGQDWIMDGGGPRSGLFALFVAAVAGALLFCGLAVFDRHPRAGATLVVLTALAIAVSMWWSPAAVIVAIGMATAAIFAARHVVRSRLDN